MNILQLKKLSSNKYTGILDAFSYDPNQCPHCGHTITPKFLHGCCFYEQNLYTGEEIFKSAYGFFKCSNFACEIDIMVCYKVTKIKNQNDTEILKLNQIKISPTPHFNHNYFLNELSPRFCKIYNQAQTAESDGLDELAGTGFRKALEFLVRDFLNSSLFPDGKNLDDLTFANCINQLDDELKSLATGANWLGSDFVHYTRKHEEFDVSDLKEFINLLSHKIDLILRTEKYTKLSEQMRVKRTEK